MKIALINNLYPPLGKGGAEFIVETCRQELERNNIEVLIITTKPYFKKISPDTNVHYLNSGYHYLSALPLWLRSFWHLAEVCSFKKYLRIKRILEKEGVDIVVTHNLKGLGMLTPAAIKKTGVKHIHTLHDIQLLHPSGLLIHGKEEKINSLPGKVYQKLGAWLFRSCPEVVSPSSWLLDLHQDKRFFINSQKKVIPNPISKNLLPDRPKHGSKEREFFTFIYAGQIEEQKGILFLTQAFKEYIRTRPGSKTRLLVVGGGSKEEEVKKTANDPHIIFKGKKNRQETLALISKADCLIMPSICYENSPMVIYEASLLGVPVLASDIGGVPELINKFGGTLFQPANKQDLIAKIEKISGRSERKKDIKKIKPISPAEYVRKLLYGSA